MLLLAPKALDENGANVPLDPQTPNLKDRQALASGSTCLSFRFGVNEPFTSDCDKSKDTGPKAGA